jgi:hypothetical protein
MLSKRKSKTGKQEGNMFKKALLVLLSILIISGVCFAGEEAAEEPIEDTAAVVEEKPTEEPAEDVSSDMAEEESAVSLEKITVCSSVEDKEPQGAGTVFSDDLDKIYCFTKIVGASDTTSVKHVWYMGDDELVSVDLAVKSASWRTWSSKLLDMGLGKGHVEVVSAGGEVLGKADFEITATAEEVEEAEEEAEETMEEEMEEATEE